MGRMKDIAEPLEGESAEQVGGWEEYVLIRLANSGEVIAVGKWEWLSHTKRYPDHKQKLLAEGLTWAEAFRFQALAKGN